MNEASRLEASPPPPRVGHTFKVMIIKVNFYMWRPFMVRDESYRFFIEVNIYL